MHLLVFLCAAQAMVASVQSASQYFIIAPNVIRVDVNETILVSVHGIGAGVQIPVTLYFQLTGSDQRISEKTVTVTKDDPQEATLLISTAELMMLAQSGKQQFITLCASANAQISIQDRRAILLSYRSGFAFIQTDKPLYTPSQRVNIRVVSLDQDMVPANKNLQVDIVNPDQIIIERYNKLPHKRFLPIQFDFPPRPVFGNWTVIAYYGYQNETQTSVQFEVKEYVLPKFSVEVAIVGAMYIVPESINVVARVTARYIFGEPVIGSYFVSFGVFQDDGSLTVLHETEGQLDDQGKGYRDMKMADITVPDWTETLMGKRLLIQAFVTDSSTGETTNVNNSAVIFSRTPYMFNWDLTQRYFKKGLPFAVKANLQFVNGLPAIEIPVTITATFQQQDGTAIVKEPITKLSGLHGELDFRIDVHSRAIKVTISMETTDATLVDANAHSTFVVQPQQSTGDEYMVVRVPLGVGDRREPQRIERQSSVEVHLTHHVNVVSLNYFVIAGGRIVHKGAINQQLVNLNTALDFTITHDMKPSARVVAYYINQATGNIIADAVLFEVEEKCQNPIGLRFKDLQKVGDTFKTDGANKDVELLVTAQEETTVGLLAVDEAVFSLRKYHRLNQKKVFKEMAMYDLGCGPGGGENSATIFKDAGVTVLTNANLVVESREVLGCPLPAGRRRRSLNEAEIEELVNSYEGIEREYCEKGMRKLKDPADITCAQRAKHLAKRKGIGQTSPEMAAFFECCIALTKGSHGRANNVDENGVNLDNIMVRSDFPESWMFTDVETDADGEAVFGATLPNSVTTWVIEAVGVSQKYGMCVDDGVKLQVRPEFFLDLGLPFSVQRFEQIEIIASVFNYGLLPLQVTVYLKGVEGLCSDALPGSYSEGQTIEVQPKQPASVKFVIVPLAIGHLTIGVAATAVAATADPHKYAIQKILTVRPEGYEQVDIVKGTLDPRNTRGSPRNTVVGGTNQSYHHTQYWADDGESKQINTIVYEFNGDAIPDTNTAYVSLMGDVMGSVVDTVIGGLDKILRIPSGCGEQTMLGLAPNVYIYTYLRQSQQLTAALEIGAKKYVSDGVQRELRFRKADGSFTVWETRPSSTWLTAFVAKVMCQAKQFGQVDDNVICKAMEWLITQTYTEPRDGSFRELYKVHHKEMTGGVQGKVSLTAFVLIALLECECNTINKDESLISAMDFLEQELPALTRPYAIAITAYALAKANRDSAIDAIVKLKAIAVYHEASDTRYWRSDDSSFDAGKKPYWYKLRPKAIEVETTSYALLALLEMDEIQYTHAIVNWLTDQENYSGGFVSTQDTVIALQALSGYAARVQQYGINMQCKVNCRETDFDETFMMQRDNAIVRQHEPMKIPESGSKLSVFFTTEGSGLGEFKFVSTYYIPESNKDDKCDFQLDINEDENAVNGGQGSEITFNIQTRYLLKEEATGMAIVEVGLYTGYEPILADLKEVKDGSNGRVQRYEVTDQSVIFYLDKIPKDEITELEFRAEREFKVGKVQPVKVRVYDYYNPTVECVKFISPVQGSARLGTLCAGDTCICAAGKCASNPYAKDDDYNAANMKTEACQSTSHFAFEVLVNGWQEKGSFKLYNVTIANPLKLGLDSVLRGQTRTFWKSISCDTPDLMKKRYLVIGARGLAAKDKNGHAMYKYVIDEGMSFYEWPSQAKATRLLRKWGYIRATLLDLKMDLINGNGCST